MFVLKRTEEKRQVLELVPPSKLNQLSPKEKKDKYASMKKDLEGNLCTCQSKLYSNFSYFTKSHTLHNKI